MTKEDAEIERLVSAITEALETRIAEMRPLTEAERLEHNDDHRFIAGLKEAHAQQKKFRLSVIEHVLKASAVGIGALVVLAIWSFIKMNVRM